MQPCHSLGLYIDCTQETAAGLRKLIAAGAKGRAATPLHAKSRWMRAAEAGSRARGAVKPATEDEGVQRRRKSNHV
jgi:hypothetical protein